VLKFFVVAVSFYGMSTFEGPMMSIRAVNAISHYTDWTIAHVHSGALGWVGMSVFGMLYYMVPRLWKRSLHSVEMATNHFWMATIGIVLYTVALWVGGVTQSLMWRAIEPTGLLQYPNFMDTLNAIQPFWWFRLVGGTLYFLGVLVMAWNLWRTATAPATNTADSRVEIA
jgi:cytochrome c oxidase cbb3-type subunit I/II